MFGSCKICFTFAYINNKQIEIMVTIKVKQNESKKTFTIRKYENGKVYAKFRTIPMSKEEFIVNTYNTENDWKSFLINSNDYYEIKK